MIKKVIIPALIIIFVNSSLFSQRIDGICNESNLFGEKINKIEYFKYEPVLQLKAIKDKTLEEVKNNTPEELIESQISVKNNKWLSFNFDKEVNWNQKRLNRIKNQNSNHNYVEIERKITFNHNSKKYAIIRTRVYDEYKDKTIVVSFLCLKKYKNRWILINQKEKSPFEFFMSNLNIKFLDALFKNLETNNQEFNKTIKKSWIDNKTFNPIEAYISIGNSMLGNKQQFKDIYVNNKKISKSDVQKDIKSIKSIISKIDTDYLIPLNQQFYCKYFPNEISEFKDLEVEKITSLIISNNDNKDSKPKIFPFFKFSYRNEKLKKIIFLKYSLEKNGVKSIKTNTFKINNDNISILNNYDNVDKRIKNIISKSKPDLLIQFSNGKDNSNYPKINKLKPLVKDANGTLNIEKLAKVIEENKSSLAKYLD